MELTAFFAILLVVAFAGGGIYLISSALTVGKRSRTHISWPSVDGKVLSSEIVESSGLTEEGVPFSTFKAVIRFKYQVAGMEYISIHIGQAAQQANSPLIAQMSAQFPVGKSVTVHFDPKNPSEAILVPPAPVARPVIIAGIGLLIISGVIACVGMAGFLFYFFTH